MINIKDFFIYNCLQADFFLQHGLIPKQIGKGNKNDIYIRYTRNSKSEKVFDEWKEIKYGKDTRPPKFL